MGYRLLSLPGALWFKVLALATRVCSESDFAQGSAFQGPSPAGASWSPLPSLRGALRFRVLALAIRVCSESDFAQGSACQGPAPTGAPATCRAREERQFLLLVGETSIAIPPRNVRFHYCNNIKHQFDRSGYSFRALRI
jgi:hypothetical protein